MKIYLIFLFLFFQNELCFAETFYWEDVTGNTVVEDTNQYEENRAQCKEIEKGFHKHILSVLDGASTTLRETSACLNKKTKSAICDKMIKDNLALLEKNRSLLKRLVEEIAMDFVKNDKNADLNLTRKCILGSSGKVQFERNIRMIKPQLKPVEDCQPTLQKWWMELDQTITDKLSGKKSVNSLTTEEVKNLATFHQSPLKRMLDTNAIYELTPPNGELQKQLALTTEKMANGVSSLKQKVAQYKDKDLHKLYIYSNQFDNYVSQKKLDPTIATQCKKSFCDGLSDSSKCLSQLLDISRDFLPIVPFIDLARIGDVMAAESGGIMTRDEASQKRSELVQNALWSLGGWGGVSEVANLARPAIRLGVKALGGKIISRAKSIQESVSAVLSGPLRQKALLYLRGNMRANREATTLFTRITTIAETKPGHIPEELFSRMQSSVSRVMGDIYSKNNLRFLKEYDEILAELANVPKGSKAYEELMGRLELRTRAIEAIYKTTDTGSFEARVYEAIREADIPDAIADDVAHCFVTGGQGRSQGFFLKYLFPFAWATIRADKFCDIPIAKILKEQDPQGWVTLPDGRKQRFLIEKWDCNDCGTENVPAWVHVLRKNDKEDLAQVTHCPGCGNPKEAHEAYYGAWKKDSRGQISNATDADIVRAGGRDKAKRATESPEHHCGFCGTIIEVDSKECKSCGAGDIAELVDLRTADPITLKEPKRTKSGETTSPHEPRDKPPESHRSGRSAAAERDKPTPDASSTEAKGKGAIVAGGVAAVTAAGAGGYYLLKGTEVEATVTGMSWRHTVSLERNIAVNKSGWRDSIPRSAFDVNSCASRYSHDTPVACGTETYTYTVYGSCSQDSLNGITVETCDPDREETGTRTKYCDEPVYRDYCNYKIYEWTHITSDSTSGSAPQAGTLPWPNLSASGSNERIVRDANYSIKLTYEVNGKTYTDSMNPVSESSFKEWRMGDHAIGTHRRATGLGNVRRK